LFHRWHKKESTKLAIERRNYRVISRNREEVKMENKNTAASTKDAEQAKKKRLSEALNLLSEMFGIEFGSITIKFHNGKWSPKIEIEKRVVEEVKD